MLNCSGITFYFYRFSQNGMYIDFFMKKLVEIFVRNIFVYTSIFFGEKYIIEYYTKKIIEQYVFTMIQKFNFFIFYYFYFFIYNLFIFFFFFSIFNLFIFFI